MSGDFDILIIGGGHAGAEAAWAAAGLGARTALLTFDRAAIGRMSCNPAIGGIGKGQIVREVDALGGLMGLVTDETGIQFRMLNRRKGPAVWAPRAQCDREEYAAAVRRRLEGRANLTLIDGAVEAIETEADRDGRGRPYQPEKADPDGRGRPYQTEEAGGADRADSTEEGPLLKSSGTGITPQTGGLHYENSQTGGSHFGAPQTGGLHYGDERPLLKSSGTLDIDRARRVTGVRLADGRRIAARAVVVTSGTFLRALMHCGEARTPGGRVGEPAAVGLSASLASLGLRLGRLKTGTPPRLDRDSIDFSRLVEQPGDEPPAPFSAMTDRIAQPQICCWITYTNSAVHAAIRENLHRAPMYSGQIESTGPRYCPSIEDKVVRFADKDKHQLFLEPEGRTSNRIYVNGISTSLPQDVQARMIASIEGLENARVLQWGYAVEYDFVPPEQIDASLMTRAVAGLFLAGQINGTSGYEEAAGQGLMAGINAARFAAGRPPVILGRDQAYIGVMIDDLVTRGVTEPYRMFTSRAEHRLHLRYDNADTRLTPLGREIGLVDDARWSRAQSASTRTAALLSLLQSERCEGRTVAEWLRRPEEDGQRFAEAIPGLAEFWREPAVWGRALVELKYAGYIERQDRLLERFREMESLAIPAGLDFTRIPHLRREALERWQAVRPINIGQASRVSGVHLGDIQQLILEVSRTTTPVAATKYEQIDP